jgi:hypothetical protein
MTNYLATLGLIFILISDYIAIIFWLMRTANLSNHTIRFSMRSLFLATTIIAVHVAIFAAFLTELPPLEH